MKLAVLLRAAAVSASSAIASAQALSIVSTDAAGVQGNMSSIAPSISADGRFVAFQSGANNFPNTSTLAFISHVFVKDLATGTLTRVDIPFTSVSDTGEGVRPMISGDGLSVVFASNSRIQVPNDTNGTYDIFVRNLAAATTERVSVDASGAQANGLSQNASISADGRFVAFSSVATNLVAGDTNGKEDVFVRDRLTGATLVASRSSAGTIGNNATQYPTISADGTTVLFQSGASNFDGVPGLGVFVHDLVLGTTTRVSVDVNQQPVSGSFFATYSNSVRRGAISRDGRWVTFISSAHLDTSSPTDGGLYLHDRATSKSQLVCVPASGPTGFAIDGMASAISDDGRFIGFSSNYRLTTNDPSPFDEDAFVRDMQLGITYRMSLKMPVPPFSGDDSKETAFSADACTVVFTSRSPDLVTGDLNARDDIFLYDWTKAAPVVFCAAGTSVQGCVATLSTSGAPSLSASSGFTIAASNADGSRNAVLLYGITGRRANPWGTSSLMCVAAPRQRTLSLSTGGASGSCNGSASLDWNAFIASHPTALGASAIELTPVVAQFWIRDPMTTIGSVLSNAVEFYACP